MSRYFSRIAKSCFHRVLRRWILHHAVGSAIASLVLMGGALVALADDPVVAPVPTQSIDFQSEQTTADVQGDSKTLVIPRLPKKVTKILPFADYNPDQSNRRADSGRSHSPRPKGYLSQKSPGDGYAPSSPKELKLEGQPFQERMFAESLFVWEPSNIFYNPLYFEDAALERYGHTHHGLLQPFVSTGKFGIRLLGLPYQMHFHPIHSKVYPLGWYRPGEYAPRKHTYVPLSLSAGTLEAGVLTALFFLIP